MAAVKERYQNPAIGDTIQLRNFMYNSNNLANVESFEKVEIYFLDPTLKSAANPDGRRLVRTIDDSAITTSDTGTYMISTVLDTAEFTIGTYLDIWYFYVNAEDTVQTVEYPFQVYPALWYATPIPVVYDFTFHFQPNRLRQGSRQYLQIEIIPNVPRASDLQRYYENIAIAASLSFSMEMACDDCAPESSDLRLIYDDEPVELREKRLAYYQLDTADMDCGLYNIWFKLEFGGNVYVSDKMQFLIYN